MITSNPDAFYADFPAYIQKAYPFSDPTGCSMIELVSVTMFLINEFVGLTHNDSAADPVFRDILSNVGPRFAFPF